MTGLRRREEDPRVKHFVVVVLEEKQLISSCYQLGVNIKDEGVRQWSVIRSVVIEGIM